jgi:hypothetical protein
MAARRTPTEDKALAWWCSKNNLVPQLSTHPVYYFVDKSTGEESNRNIKNLTTEFKRERDQEKRESKRKNR